MTTEKTIAKRREIAKSWKDYLKQQQKRERQLLSGILECFLEHKKNTLEDLKVLVKLK